MHRGARCCCSRCQPTGNRRECRRCCSHSASTGSHRECRPRCSRRLIRPRYHRHRERHFRCNLLHIHQGVRRDRSRSSRRKECHSCRACRCCCNRRRPSAQARAQHRSRLVKCGVRRACRATAGCTRQTNWCVRQQRRALRQTRGRGSRRHGVRLAHQARSALRCDRCRPTH